MTDRSSGLVRKYAKIAESARVNIATIGRTDGLTGLRKWISTMSSTILTPDSVTGTAVNRGESEIWSLLEHLGTHPDRGLSNVEVYNRLRRFGTNETERPYVFFTKVRCVALVCFAAGVVLAIDMMFWYAAGPALISILLMVFELLLRKQFVRRIAVCEEYAPETCSAIREGLLLRLPACQLVPGDIVRVQVGDTVPADGRLIEAVNLLIQSNLLLGCSQPMDKDALQPDDPSVPIEDCINRVSMSTVVIRGRGTFVVTETGSNTRIGQIQASVHK